MSALAPVVAAERAAAAAAVAAAAAERRKRLRGLVVLLLERAMVMIVNFGEENKGDWERKREKSLKESEVFLPSFFISHSVAFFFYSFYSVSRALLVFLLFLDCFKGMLKGILFGSVGGEGI